MAVDMPKVTIYPNGSSGGFAGPGREKNDDGNKRQAIRGWTTGSSRRLVAWLWSVNPDALGEDGWAVTLTMGGTPATSDDWHRARRQFEKRMQRAGVDRLCWVTEWTAKGRPHMHIAMYGPDDIEWKSFLAWLDICEKNGWPARFKAQHVERIYGATGWLKYVSKHAARGVDHYQRQGAPEGWEKTGRLWGKSGEWPEVPGTEIDLDDAQFYRYRRLVTAWQVARVKRESEGKLDGRNFGRQFGDRERGRFMGVSGWIPDAVAYTLLLTATEGRLRPSEPDWESAPYVTLHTCFDPRNCRLRKLPDSHPLARAEGR